MFVRLAPTALHCSTSSGRSPNGSPFPLAELVVGRTITYDVAANWKVLAENYNECYHCGPVHPELCDWCPRSRRGGAALDWESGIPHRARRRHLHAAAAPARSSFPGLDEAERATTSAS